MRRRDEEPLHALVQLREAGAAQRDRLAWAHVVVGKTNALILQESLGFLTGMEKVGAFREDDDHACGLQGTE